MLLEKSRKTLLAADLDNAFVQQRMSTLDTVAAHFQVQDLAPNPDDRPFANPYWWAAFQCVGSGWSVNNDKD